MRSINGIIRALCAVLVGLTVLFAFAGCSNVEETSANTDVEKYYIFRLDASAYQAYVFDLSDGSITVACPDTLCPHTPDREKCPFSNGIAAAYVRYVRTGKKLRIE